MSVSPPPTPGLHNSFDDNTDDLLHLLTDTWNNPLKANISDSKWTRDYLTKLTSLPLEELLHEPSALREEQAKAKRDAQNLAFRDYPSFLHAQTCRHEAEETLDGLHAHLGEFLLSVPELQQACQEFAEHAKDLKEERGKITSVLEHQNVLTDLLEIPQLMETCVWNGYYSEAMDLASHVRLLQVRYPLSVIKSIQDQVQASSDLMLVQLISHLRKPIRLAAAMNVVGFLRRMDVFGSEFELQMVFLRCRDDFLQQRLIRIKRDMSEDVRQRSVDAFEYLKRYVDVMREQMFEIGTQYISIFSKAQDSLLSDYMAHTIGLIKTALNTHLPMIEDTSALASLLAQLQYCGMSLGRIGLDFRHIFVHSFEEAVQPMILKWIDAATEDLVKQIIKSTEEASAPSTWMSSKIVSQSGGQSTNETEARRHAYQPPMILVGYPSLAIFTNGILSAFNALRLLPALSLFSPILNHLEACFLEIGNDLKQYADQAVSHIPDEITYLQSFSAAYVRCCVPYLKSCLIDGIFGELSESYVPDDDLELLLQNYLPIIKKDDTTNNEDIVNESNLGNSIVKESTEDESIEDDFPQEAVNKLIPLNESSDMQGSTTPDLQEPLDLEPKDNNTPTTEKDNSTKDEDVPEISALEIIKEPVEKTIEPTIEEPVEPIENSAEKPVEKPAEENIETRIDEITESVAEEVIEDPLKEASQEVQKELSEDAVNLTDNEKVKEASEKIVEKMTEQLVNEVVEEVVENSVEKTLEKVVNQTTEEVDKEEANEKIANESAEKIEESKMDDIIDVNEKITGNDSTETLEENTRETAEKTPQKFIEEVVEKTSLSEKNEVTPNEKETPVTEKPILEESTKTNNVQENILPEQDTNIPENPASTESTDKKGELIQPTPEKKPSKKSNKKHKGKKGKR